MTSIQYDSHYNSNSDDDVEFVDVDLPCNKFGMQLLANTSPTCNKKRHINKTEKEAIRTLKVDITRENEVPVECIRKKSSKTSVSISGHFKYPASDV